MVTVSPAVSPSVVQAQHVAEWISQIGLAPEPRLVHGIRVERDACRLQLCYTRIKVTNLEIHHDV